MDVHKEYLAPNFTLGEFLQTRHLDIDNTRYTPEVLDNLRLLANTMQRLRDRLEVPLIISSGWRCPELNARVGGAAHSKHLLGLACDFIAPALGNPYLVARVTEQALQLFEIGFDKLIYEGDTRGRRWVHLQINDSGGGARRVLTLKQTGPKTWQQLPGIQRVD